MPEIKIAMPILIKCFVCEGKGWYSDHSDKHYGNLKTMTCEEAGCPVERYCEYCNGTGWI